MNNYKNNTEVYVAFVWDENGDIFKDKNNNICFATAEQVKDALHEGIPMKLFSHLTGKISGITIGKPYISDTTTVSPTGKEIPSGYVCINYILYDDVEEDVREMIKKMYLKTSVDFTDYETLQETISHSNHIEPHRVKNLVIKHIAIVDNPAQAIFNPVLNPDCVSMVSFSENQENNKEKKLDNMYTENMQQNVDVKNMDTEKETDKTKEIDKTTQADANTEPSADNSTDNTANVAMSQEPEQNNNPSGVDDTQNQQITTNSENISNNTSDIAQINEKLQMLTNNVELLADKNKLQHVAIVDTLTKVFSILGKENIVNFSELQNAILSDCGVDANEINAEILKPLATETPIQEQIDLIVNQEGDDAQKNNSQVSMSDDGNTSTDDSNTDDKKDKTDDKQDSQSKASFSQETDDVGKQQQRLNLTFEDILNFKLNVKELVL